MIEFNCPNRKFDGTPVVCDLEVMAYAEAQVGDYKPELLKTPGKINALHFVESYLGAAVDVQNILNAGLFISTLRKQRLRRLQDLFFP